MFYNKGYKKGLDYRVGKNRDQKAASSHAKIYENFVNCFLKIKLQTCDIEFLNVHA